MLHINHYYRPDTLEEAWQLRQKRGSAVLGGTGWLRLGEHTIQHAIDLSSLGLDYIREDENGFLIGAMTTLRTLECCKELNDAFDGGFVKAVEHIVGVQFRNCATIGGSVYGRFGFSDVLTLLLALDAEVHLYREGWVPIVKFAKRSGEADILTEIRIRKNRRVAYLSERLNANDFPACAVAVSRGGEGWQCVIGARPCRAKLVKLPDDLDGCDRFVLQKIAQKAAGSVTYGGGMRGGPAYRQAVAAVLIRRGIEALYEKGGQA